MVRKVHTLGGILLLAIFVLGVVAVPAALAQSSTTQQLRCKVVRRTAHGVVVTHKHPYARLVIRRGQHYATVRGLRYAIMKRTRQFVTLRARPRKPPAPAASVLSVGCSVTASSEEGGAGAKNANDGSTSTRWAADSGAFPQTWTVDLGSTASLKDVRIDWYSGTARAYGYRIEVSTDGVAFATAVDRSKNKTAGATTDAVSAQARYVRVQVLGATAASAWASANEITVRGTPPRRRRPPRPRRRPRIQRPRQRRRLSRRRHRPRRRSDSDADARSDSGPHADTDVHSDADADSQADVNSYGRRRRRRRLHRLRRLSNSPCSAT